MKNHPMTRIAVGAITLLVAYALSQRGQSNDMALALVAGVALYGQSSKYTGNFNQHYEKILQDNVFMNGLRTGGKSNGLLCDCIVIRSGEPFTSGQNWQWTTFSQA